MAVLGVVFAAAALAADITGNWTGNMALGDNQFTLNYTFKVDGEKLTGAILTPQGDSLPLIDGKVEGDKVSFAVKTDIGNGMMTFASTGTIKSAEEIVLSTKTPDGYEFGGGPVTIRRVK